MDKLEALRAKLRKKQIEGTTDNALYPFWKTPIGKNCTLRFLPDKDPETPFFWVEKVTFKWAFPDNENPGKMVYITMPSIETYEGPKTCPVTKELMPIYKDDKELCRKFWPKRAYLMQGFVRRGHFEEENPPENPIRIFTVNRELYKIIYDGIMEEDPDLKMDEFPVDFEDGRDFIVKVKKDGEWPDYGTSQWAPNGSPLTDDELAAIEQHKLFSLKDRLPPRPSKAAFEMQLHMLNAGLNGEPWDPEWEECWKPYRPDAVRGNNSSDEDEVVVKKTTVRKTVAKEEYVEDDDIDIENDVDDVDDVDDVENDDVEVTKPTKKTPEEILAEIRKKKSRTS